MASSLGPPEARISSLSALAVSARICGFLAALRVPLVTRKPVPQLSFAGGDILVS
jgi:hypothetical protein